MLRVKASFYGIILCIIGVVFWTCEPEEQSQTANGTEEERSIQAMVKHLYNPPSEDSVVPNATIQLYADRQSRDAEVDLQRKATTDTAGKAEFHYLKEDSYFVKVTHSRLGARETNISTPPGTVSHLQVVYE